MATLEIKDEDAPLLRDILETRLADLRMEISHTDSMRFREGLKDKKRVIEEALRQLPQER